MAILQTLPIDKSHPPLLSINDFLYVLPTIPHTIPNNAYPISGIHQAQVRK